MLPQVREQAARPGFLRADDEEIGQGTESPGETARFDVRLGERTSCGLIHIRAVSARRARPSKPCFAVGLYPTEANEMAGRLAGKVAIITGASRGLGQYCALGYAREGAIVAVAARTEQVTDPRLPGTIHHTAQLVNDAGGEG